MGLDSIYDPGSDGESEELNTVAQMLVSWVVGHVQSWEDYRDSNYERRWEEYYRIWRGVWKAQDKTRDTERSRLISPATSQAIEVAVAEVEEAIFGRGKFFDISDDVDDNDAAGMQAFRNRMHEDLEEWGFKRDISEALLNGGIYGTGIAKLAVEESQQYVFGAAADELGALFSAQLRNGVKLRLVPVEPMEFAIDPVAKSVDDALGCAHTPIVPRHQVVRKQQAGIYRDVSLGSYVANADFNFDAKGEVRHSYQDEIKLTEYHGLVPAALLNIEDDDPDVIQEAIDSIKGNADDSTLLSYDDDTEMVEAIVTIANDTELLRAVPNPYTMKDRSFLAYQHDTVPNRFWGRGVAEKGYNPQKALDAELRGRMDAMGLTIHPMMGVNTTMIPRGADFSVRPGKNVFINGDPREALHPMRFGQVDNNTFTQSGELERMIQMATGSMDSATPITQNPRNNTLGGMSIMQAGAIKRSKRTLSNIETQFIKPLVKKCAWRLMQFDPERYPPMDTKFVVHSTLGIMARELEMQQLASLLSTTQGNTVGYWMLMRSIYEHTSVPNREAMVATAESMLQKSLNPQPSEDAMVKREQLAHEKERDLLKLQIEKSRADTERMRVQKEIAQLEAQIAKLNAETDKTSTEAEAKRRQTIVETEDAINRQKNELKKLDQKDAEIALKAKAIDKDITLAQNEILAEKDIKAMELRASGAKAAGGGNVVPFPEGGMPVVNIKTGGRKIIRVTQTENGLEGVSEPADEGDTDGTNTITIQSGPRRVVATRTATGLEGYSEPIEEGAAARAPGEDPQKEADEGPGQAE